MYPDTTNTCYNFIIRAINLASFDVENGKRLFVGRNFKMYHEGVTYDSNLQ